MLVLVKIIGVVPPVGWCLQTSGSSVLAKKGGWCLKNLI